MDASVDQSSVVHLFIDLFRPETGHVPGYLGAGACGSWLQEVLFCPSASAKPVRVALIRTAAAVATGRRMVPVRAAAAEAESKGDVCEIPHGPHAGRSVSRADAFKASQPPIGRTIAVACTILLNRSRSGRACPCTRSERAYMDYVYVGLARRSSRTGGRTAVDADYRWSPRCRPRCIAAAGHNPRRYTGSICPARNQKKPREA